MPSAGTKHIMVDHSLNPVRLQETVDAIDKFRIKFGAWLPTGLFNLLEVAVKFIGTDGKIRRIPENNPQFIHIFTIDFPEFRSADVHPDLFSHTGLEIRVVNRGNPRRRTHMSNGINHRAGCHAAAFSHTHKFTQLLPGKKIILTVDFRMFLRPQSAADQKKQMVVLQRRSLVNHQFHIFMHIIPAASGTYEIAYHETAYFYVRIIFYGKPGQDRGSILSDFSERRRKNSTHA